MLFEKFLNEAVEFWIETEEGMSLEKRDGKIFLEEYYQDQSVTVRYLNRDGKGGLSYTTVLNEKSLLETIERARLLSEYGYPTVYFEEFKQSKYPSLREEKIEVHEFSEKLKREILPDLEEMVYERKIKRLEKLEISVSRIKRELYRKDFSLSWEEPNFFMILSVVAEGKEREASAYEWYEGKILDLDEIKARIERVCHKAQILGEAKKGKTMKIPVLFPPEIGVELLDLLEFSFSGEEVLKGRSKLKDNLGKKIFSKILTIWDDGVTEHLLEARPFDDEGAPQDKKTLVEKGVIKNFLFDTYWKREAEVRGLGTFKAGNARRPNFASAPKIGATNLYIQKGETGKEKLLTLYDEVFEVLEVLGAHTADPISGEFTFGVSGIYYKKGEPVEYFCEMALNGNIFEVFQRLVAIGNDLRFYGSLGSPSLIVESMDLGG